MQINQIRIFRVLSDPSLNLCTLLIDNPQIALVGGRGTEQNLVYKTHFFLGAELLDAAYDKVAEYRRVLGADGYNHIPCQNNAKRDCRVALFAVADFDCRNIHKYQGVAVLKFNTGAFLFIECCLHIANVDV